MEVNVELKKWINGIYIYFEILNEININFLQLIGLDCIHDVSLMEKLYLDISQDIIRIIPCVISKETEEISLNTKDGIFDFKDDLNYLINDFTELFNKNKDELYRIKKIRSKTEHVPHKLKAKSFVSGNCSSKIKFEYKNDKLYVNTEELKKIIKNLNIIFTKVQKDLENYRDSLDKYDAEHPYFRNVLYMKFEKYNEIFDNDSLDCFSKIINKVKNN